MRGELRFLFRTDVHSADKNPASWKANYAQEIDSSLRQVGRWAIERSVHAVLDGGDFFHVKNPARNSHGLVRRMVDLHREAYRSTPVYIVEGNHDITNQNLGSVQDQPLGVMLASGTFRPLREEVFRAGALQVRVVGLPYVPDRTRESIQVRKQPGDTHLILIVHALAGEKPPATVEDFFGEPVFQYDEFAQVFDGPDAIFFGHWHKDQGITTLDTPSGVCHFVNLGALSRGSLVHENLTRTPKAAFFTVTERGITIEELPLSVAPPSDVFDLEKKEQRDKEREEITAFVERLQSDLQSLQAPDLVAALRGAGGFAVDVVNEAVRYLEEVG